MKNYIKSFTQLNEASELIKMGVPKDMAKIIHTMSGGAQETRPFKLQSGKEIERGVEFEEYPVSHDIALVKTIEKTKSYDNSILDYLDNLPAGEKCSLLLISPGKYADYMHYIMYKSTSVQHATKGNQYRVVTIDKETGQAISKWAGTNGQLAGAAPIGTKLYVFEKENRVERKKDKRKASREYTNKQFVEVIVKNYTKVITAAFGKYKKSAEKKFYEKLTGLSINDIVNTLSQKPGYRTGQEYKEIEGKFNYPNEKEIKKYSKNWEKVGELIDLGNLVKRDIVDPEQLENEIPGFVEYINKNETLLHGIEEPSISDIINLYSLIGTTTKFLQFVIYGKAVLRSSEEEVNLMKDIL